MTTANEPSDSNLLAALWHGLGGATGLPDHVRFSGPERLLPSVYNVGALASASIAAASLAVAELSAARLGTALPDVHIDRAHAAVAFRSERYLSARGWQLPEVWDPLAGDYATRDGFIRLHTNYGYHRAAVLQVLQVKEDRTAVAEAVRMWEADALEHAVVAAGGCAAALRSAADWARHPQGLAVAREPVFAVDTEPARKLELPEPRAGSPLAGVRVLDLTRVIAGPTGTRLLAAYGAEVLRIDPPGFEEVGLLLCDVTAGKRRASLDLRAAADRERFERLLGQAHLLVHGLRADALERLGYGSHALWALNPDLRIVTHNAYGFLGPWAQRRGFDSLVQMSCGIAQRGREASGNERPVPLPAQALDHATGYLIAAAACRALTRGLQSGEVTCTRLSLARTAQLLMSLGDGGDIHAPDVPSELVSRYLEPAGTRFGPVTRVRCPGTIEGVPARLHIPAGPLGSDAPSFDVKP